MQTISLKLTPEQARLVERAARESGLPSKSEFVRYALARVLEEKLSVQTIEEVFEARQQVRSGRTISLAKFKASL